MSKLSRIKEKAAAINQKKAQLATTEAELEAHTRERFADIAQRKKNLAAAEAEAELAEEIAAITDTDAADDAPVKAKTAKTLA